MYFTRCLHSVKENGEFAYQGVDVLHLTYDLLGQVQVQVDVFLLAADGVVAFAPGAARHMLAKLSIGTLLLTPGVRQIGECSAKVKCNNRKSHSNTQFSSVRNV